MRRRGFPATHVVFSGRRRPRDTVNPHQHQCFLYRHNNTPPTAELDSQGIHVRKKIGLQPELSNHDRLLSIRNGHTLLLATREGVTPELSLFSTKTLVVTGTRRNVVTVCGLSWARLQSILHSFKEVTVVGGLVHVTVSIQAVLNVGTVKVYPN